MNEERRLEIDCQRIGKSKFALVTRYGGKTEFSDETNLVSADHRDKCIDRICAKIPSLGRAVVEKKILEIVGELARARRNLCMMKSRCVIQAHC